MQVYPPTLCIVGRQDYVGETGGVEVLTSKCTTIPTLTIQLTIGLFSPYRMCSIFSQVWTRCVAVSGDLGKTGDAGAHHSISSRVAFDQLFFRDGEKIMVRHGQQSFSESDDNGIVCARFCCSSWPAPRELL